MGNHSHVLLEITEANLVVGMQWLQGTYTKRFNARHREWGHLFQGRYKAIPVEPGGDYFTAIATYIHLNPVRMKGYDFEKSQLPDYRWSSYPAYVGKSDGFEWLCVSRLLGNLGMADTPAGRRKYAEYISGRIADVRHSDQPWKADECWQKIRRGWYFGGEGFRADMLNRLEKSLKKGKRDSYSGDEDKTHDVARAEELIAAGMQRLGLQEDDLGGMIKNSPEKYALAWLVRRNTCVGTGWIKDRLQMGKATNFAEMLRKLESARRDEWGFEAYTKAVNIKS